MDIFGYNQVFTGKNRGIYHVEFVRYHYYY